ncbi:MAG: transcriptional repressor [Limnochordales bacterium]|nr:transcriptional repressor [Limnochordales bacterium]
MRTDEALRQLRRQGGRVTPQRRALVELLASATRPLTAPELHARLIQQFPEVAQDTVYRILESLVAIDAVEVFHDPSQGADRYEWSDRPHHHCVCLGCGSVVCLPECPVDAAAESMQLPAGFQVVRHEYQVFGYCDGCRSNRSAKPPARRRKGKRGQLAASQTDGKGVEDQE